MDWHQPIESRPSLSLFQPFQNAPATQLPAHQQRYSVGVLEKTLEAQSSNTRLTLHV
jgi:hypothetical protein